MATPLLTTPMRLPDRRLWRGRACLFEDCVLLSGWMLRGRYRRRLSLERVERPAWWTGGEAVNFALHLRCGETVALHLREGAGTWKFKVEALLGLHASEAPLPGEAGVPRNAAA